MARIGLIAGRGRLPELWAQAAKKKGHKIFAFSISNNDFTRLSPYVQKVEQVELGLLDQLITNLKKNRIEKIVMLGKVEKSQLFQIKPDQRLQSLLTRLENHNDDTILRGLAGEFEKEGIEVLPQSSYLEEFLPSPGFLGNYQPEKAVIEDMAFAFEMAQEIGKLDIGQTILVRDKTVLAVEAVEGTDKTIQRAGELAGKGIIMAKVSKPGQDKRFDLPTVGLTTLDNLIQAGAVGLVIEAGNTFLLNQEEFLDRADKAELAVYAADDGSFD